MAFREIFTGGACGADQNQQSHQRTNNPFHNFMGQMFYGPAQNREKLEGFVNDGGNFQNVEQNMHERQLAFQNMGKEWDVLAKEFDQKNAIDMKMMEEQWIHEQKHHEEMMKLAHENAWNEANEMYKADKWAEGFQMDQAFQDAQKEVEIQNKDPLDEQKIIKKSAIEMIEVMKNDPEERFQNSKFLQFLMKLDTGEYKIEGNQLITNNGKSKEEQVLDQIFNESEQNVKEAHLNEAWEESKAQYFNSS